MPVLFEKKWDADKGDWSVDLDADDVPNYNDAFKRFDRRIRYHIRGPPHQAW